VVCDAVVNRVLYALAAKPPIPSVLHTLLTARNDALEAPGLSHDAPRIVVPKSRLCPMVSQEFVVTERRLKGASRLNRRALQAANSSLIAFREPGSWFILPYKPAEQDTNPRH
jgi:hypothetical protein